MSRTACPGQDTRYWRPDDIFTIPCPACGSSVEFFKDEARRTCRTCSHPVHNPRLAGGCAQWCAMADQCLEKKSDAQ